MGCVFSKPRELGHGVRVQRRGLLALAVHQQQPTWPEAEAGVEAGGEEAVGRGDGDGDSEADCGDVP